MYWSEAIMSNVTFLMLLLILMSSSQVSTSHPLAKQQDNTIPSLRLLSPSSSNREVSSSLPPPPPSSSSSLGSPLMKSRWVRDIHEGVSEDELPLFNQDYSLSSPQHRQQSPPQSSSSKAKGIYPPLTGSGELFKLFRPLALRPERTIGMTKWYLPGFGYFSRGGRASSNFIRFGRSGNSRLVEEEDENTPFNRNYAKKKNNFIRLGRENPRQTNFIRLGRSGGVSSGDHDHAATAVGGEYYNSGYITSALSDPLRTTSAVGGEGEDNTRVDFN